MSDTNIVILYKTKGYTGDCNNYKNQDQVILDQRRALSR